MFLPFHVHYMHAWYAGARRTSDALVLRAGRKKFQAVVETKLGPL